MISLPRFSVRNPVLVNIVMMAIIVTGVYCALTLTREMFPESRPNKVLIRTAYPGATPAEVEKGITLKIEEKIKDVEGIDEQESTSSEGLSTIVVKLESDYDDVDQAVNDIKAAVDSIPREDFPEEAEEPVVRKFEPKWPVISVALYGDVDDRTLKTLGERARQDMLALPQVTDVDLSGTRLDEISVEVSPDKLMKYGLSLLDVRDAIASANLDLPGGQIKTASANVAVRTLGERDRGEDLYDIVVSSDPEGRRVTLRDVSHIVDGFEDSDVSGRFMGKPAVNLTVFKTSEQDAIDIAANVRALVAGKRRMPLTRDPVEGFLARVSGRDPVREVYEHALNDPYPAGVEVMTHTDLSQYIEGRLNLLRRNGLWGLALVFLSLLCFLNWRVAFWVMMGLVLAVCGVAICMKFMGLTLNLMTMFGLIVVLGMLVDDAIIVGENVFSKVEQGMSPALAAVEGPEEVTAPVTVAIATTIVAFIPLMFIKGQIGDWMGVLPMIVILALSASLLEAFTTLPVHLAHGLKPVRQLEKESAGHHHTFQVGVVLRLRRIQEYVIGRALKGGYRYILERVVRYRYVTAGVMVAMLMVALAAVGAGHVPFVFLQKMDSEKLTVDLKMGINAPIKETTAAMKVVEDAVLDLPELRCAYTLLGLSLPDGGQGLAERSPHLATMIVELSPTDQRERTSEQIMRALRDRTRNIPGVTQLKFSPISGGPEGDPIQLEVSGDDLDNVMAVVNQMQARIAEYEGVQDLFNDFDAGRREVRIKLLDSARALGLTTRSLASQVRAAFYGAEARKVQRGREDVKIMIRYPPAHRREVYDAESMYLGTPGGSLVPFTEVARLTEGTGNATIHRTNQHRTVTIHSDVDEAVGNASQIIAQVRKELPAVMRANPGVSLRFTGQQLETRKSMGSIREGFMVALLLIYVLIAGQLKSYFRPMIVMAAIPFGLVGVVVGHFIMGFPVTILSMIGTVALTGIVVNDSLILLTFIIRRVERGEDHEQAVLETGQQRLRAILLTTITTVLGLAPLMAEQSFQARFLIPMAISIAYGLIFATALTLLAVPAFYMISVDFHRMAAGLWGWVLSRPAPSEAA